jgi:hypothetical protein
MCHLEELYVVTEDSKVAARLRNTNTKLVPRAPKGLSAHSLSTHIVIGMALENSTITHQVDEWLLYSVQQL